MRIHSQFDPIFAREARRDDDQAGAERKAFAFDGWPNQPITAPREVRAAAIPEPAR